MQRPFAPCTLSLPFLLLAACFEPASGDELADDGTGADDLGTTESTDAGETSDSSTSSDSGTSEDSTTADSTTADSSSTSTESADSTGGVPCGNGILDDGEQCDDGNTLDFDACTTLCTTFEAPLLELTLAQVKQFEFAWQPVVGAEFYQLLESADEGAPFVQVGGDVVGTATALTVPLHFRLNASYVLRACSDAEGCVESAAVAVEGHLVEAIGYFKASNPDAGDSFGWPLALSGDGSRLAVGAGSEDSSTTTIGGNQGSNSAPDAGAIYVFVRDEQNGWMQESYIKAANADAGDYFGGSVAISDDGQTLAVGALYEDSNAIGIGGNHSDNSATDAGAVYVFDRNGQNEWTQSAYIKASNTDAGDRFGNRVVLSGDGGTMAVAAYREGSAAVGVGGNQMDDNATNAGAVYVFVRDGQGDWSQQSYIKASNTDAGDAFGFGLALSKDATTLAVGAYYEDSSATGIGNGQEDDSAASAGAAYVFVYNGQGWSQQAYIKASNTDAGDYFGVRVALNGDGSTLAVGAQFEDGNAIGIGGLETDNSAMSAGAVYIFDRNAQGAWAQHSYIKASNTDAGDYFGTRVALSEDGDTLLVGAYGEDGGTTGIGGNESDSSSLDAGAAYLFTRDVQGWGQRAYIKASNTSVGDEFGRDIGLSSDASVIAIGAYLEDSDSMGISSDQGNNSAVDAGAVYVY